METYATSRGIVLRIVPIAEKIGALNSVLGFLPKSEIGRQVTVLVFGSGVETDVPTPRFDSAEQKADWIISETLAVDMSERSKEVGKIIERVLLASGLPKEIARSFR